MRNLTRNVISALYGLSFFIWFGEEFLWIRIFPYSDVFGTIFWVMSPWLLYYVMYQKIGQSEPKTD